eukprot:COSAG01_NODE_143_length_24153_cov_54.226116_2_plen_195_part_00
MRQLKKIMIILLLLAAMPSPTMPLLAPLRLAPPRRYSRWQLQVAQSVMASGAASPRGCDGSGSLALQGHLTQAWAHLTQPRHWTQAPPSPCGSIGGHQAKRTQAAMRASARAHRHWLPSWGLGALALGAGIVTPGTGLSLISHPFCACLGAEGQDLERCCTEVGAARTCAADDSGVGEAESSLDGMTWSVCFSA